MDKRYRSTVFPDLIYYIKDNVVMVTEEPEYDEHIVSCWPLEEFLEAVKTESDFVEIK